MQDDENTIGRRRLLRRAGTVAAGVAGAGAVGAAAAAAPAEAAAGEPVLQGQDNPAGATTTKITNVSATAPTLALSNTVVSQTGEAGPALQLNPSGLAISPSAPVGSLAADANGDIWSSVSYGTGQSYLFSNNNATMTVMLYTAQRVLDTKWPANRTGVLNPSVIDSTGRVIGGQTLNLDLGAWVQFGHGLLANLTVVDPTAGGYVTIYPYGVARPNAASINHLTGTLSNFTATAIGWFADPNQPQDVISIFCQRTTRVILDAVGFVVGSPAQVLQGTDPPPSNAAATTLKSSSREVRRQRALKVLGER
jgi:hypothetical protein